MGEGYLVQTDYVVETVTEKNVQEDQSVSLDRGFKVIGLEEFIVSYRCFFPKQNDQDAKKFWYQLFGAVDENDIMLGHNPCFLTEESCGKILEYHSLFLSGMDFHHLPRGFFVAKNPRKGGIRSILHYSDYIAKYSAQSDDPLSVVLSDKGTYENDEANLEPFKQSEPLYDWHTFLNEKRKNRGQSLLCTQTELRLALDSFYRLISVKKLKFYRLRFNRVIDEPDDYANPIVLLGRWATIISNPALSEKDRQTQWEVLTLLNCANGYSPLRAITDYQYSSSPCTILLPEMFMEDEHHPPYSGVNSIKKTEYINGDSDFWRFLAYQDRRNSIGFYTACLEAIGKMHDLSSDAVMQMKRLLVSSTTGDNLDRSWTEGDQLEIWKKFCNTIDNLHTSSITMRVCSLLPDVKNNLKSEAISRIAMVTGMNFSFLLDSLETIKHFLGGFAQLGKLDDLSEKIVRLNSSGPGFYTGAKFYFVNRKWNFGLNLDKYTELQYALESGFNIKFSLAAGGADYKYECIENLRFMYTILKSLLSTFSIKNKDDVLKVIDAIKNLLDCDSSESIYYRTKNLCQMLRYFRDAIEPIKEVQPLLEIIWSYGPSSHKHYVEDELVILDDLECKFPPYFPESYFDKKREEIGLKLRGCLPIVQKIKIENLNFPTDIRNRIIQTEQSLVRVYDDIDDRILDTLNDKFVKCSTCLVKADFDWLTDKIAELSNHVLKNNKKRHSVDAAQSLDDLFQAILDQRSIEAFARIYYANRIECCFDPFIFQRFYTYICDICPISDHLKINRLISEDLLAKFVLNATTDQMQEDHFKERLCNILKPFESIVDKYPHFRGNVLKAFNHFARSDHYLDNVSRFTTALMDLCQLLPPEKDGAGPYNMTLIYHMLARFSEKPDALIILTDIILSIKDNDKQRVLLMVAAQQVNPQKESLDLFSQIVTDWFNDQCSNKLYLFLQPYLSSPPYLSLKQISCFLNHFKDVEAPNDVDLKEYLRPFLQTPFGERRLEYAFNHQKFDVQKSLFTGTGIRDDIFTEETADKIVSLTNTYRKTDVIQLKNQYSAFRGQPKLSDEEKLDLLCICTEMLARTSSQMDPVRVGSVISQELNTTQMMVLYVLLTSSDSKLMSQIDTGEGKSRITMVLAACQVAQGKTVDIITSDLPLSERDYLAYGHFFASLNIHTGFISLETPPELYQKNGVNFSDNSQLILMRNKSDIDLSREAWLDCSASKRCLIIDEVDKFMHDKSMDAYNYADRSASLKGFTWIYPLLIEFVRESNLSKMVDTERAFVTHVNKRSSDIAQIASVASLLENNPKQIKVWLESAQTAINMKKDVDYAMTDLDAMSPVVDTENNIRFTRKILVLDNGRPVEGSAFSDGVHQCLCAIENSHQGTKDFVILPENKVLRTSFPINFMRLYDTGRIFGFSGTTRSEFYGLNKEINYEGYSYITVPRHNRLIREDKPIYGAMGQLQQFKFIKREILEKLKRNQPILIICKDDQQSSNLFQRISKDSDIAKVLSGKKREGGGEHCTRVHALTDKLDEIQAVKNAGQPGQITISTAGMFSRGVDIDSENLFVIAAYVPSFEDEVQIKGRTARAGHPGEYRMILDLTDSDYSINTSTYNLEREVQKTQSRLSSENVTQEEISKLYALFLEEVHQKFFANYTQYSGIEQKEYLEQWTNYLDQLNKNWKEVKKPLLDQINEKNLIKVEQQFEKFTQTWIREIPLTHDEQNIPLEPWPYQKNVVNTFKALTSYRDLPPLSHVAKVQSRYDRADDGQTRIYSTLFAQTKAMFRGERPLFANAKAYWQGRGTVFPDLKALLAGERDLFANLRATISRLIESMSYRLGTKNKPTL